MRDPTCGVKPGNYSTPWQVAFAYQGSKFRFCGGTLISDRHVLAAAYCTYIRNGRNIDVIIGEHRLTSSTDGRRHSVCRFVDHPDYLLNPRPPFDHDLSILHLNKPVQLGDRAIPACLPLPSFGGDFFDGKTLTVSEWRRLSQEGGTSTVLHSVDVPGITNEQCNRPNLYNSQITEAMMCAGNAGGGIDSCYSGGKLL